MLCGFSKHRLVPYKKLGFISKDVMLAQPPLWVGRPALTLSLSNSTTNKVIPHLETARIPSEGGAPVQVCLTRSHMRCAGRGAQVRPVATYVSIPKLIAGQAIDILTQKPEFKKNFDNLVNAKSAIIGKIRSIKLVELIDKMKEEIIIAEKLAALVRVADITDLNLINKKQFRRINASKYLNKKNIYRSNRIKILQTIETIKTDLRFDPKLDSNSLSIIPVSLLYYSNLKS